jgi:hypothetical protein
MSGKSEIIKKIKLIENIHDRDDFINEFKKVLEGIKKVSEGFLEIADGLNKIGRKKYYQELGYKTFESFCNDIFGFTRKTVYLYLRIINVMEKYPEIFKKKFVIELGPAKMEKIITGINKIETSNLDKEKKINKINQLLKDINTDKSLGEINDLVNSFISKLKPFL